MTEEGEFQEGSEGEPRVYSPPSSPNRMMPTLFKLDPASLPRTEGWVWKKGGIGGSGIRRRNWKKRWFELTNDFLIGKVTTPPPGVPTIAQALAAKELAEASLANSPAKRDGVVLNPAVSLAAALKKTVSQPPSPMKSVNSSSPKKKSSGQEPNLKLGRSVWGTHVPEHVQSGASSSATSIGQR